MHSYGLRATIEPEADDGDAALGPDAGGAS